MKKSVKNVAGITLIALVITIIVLLILAGVSIATLSGNNGILTQANTAKIKTEASAVKEQISIAYTASYDTNANINIDMLKQNLTDSNINIIKSDFPLLVEKDNYNYYIRENGEVLNYVQDGLMLHYDGFNNTGTGHDNNSTIWKDLSGNSHDGTVNGATWKDNYLEFDGVDDWVTIGEMNYENVTLEVVIVNHVATSTAKEFICNFEAGGYGLAISPGSSAAASNKNGFSVYINNRGYSYLYSSSSNITNKLYSLSGSYDGNTMKLKENSNTFSSSVSGQIKYPNANSSVLLGANPYGSSPQSNFYLSGRIYSARIYNRALTDDEIANNYKIDKELFNIEE